MCATNLPVRRWRNANTPGHTICARCRIGPTARGLNAIATKNNKGAIPEGWPSPDKGAPLGDKPGWSSHRALMVHEFHIYQEFDNFLACFNRASTCGQRVHIPASNWINVYGVGGWGSSRKAQIISPDLDV